MGTSRGLWSRVKEALTDFLFPPRCVGCGRAGEWFCDRCLAQVERILPPYCRLCGRSIPQEGLCPFCREEPPCFQGLRSVAFYEGTLREAIHRFKYNRTAALSQPLGSLMAEYLADFPLPAEVLVPVPLHPKRLHERGFNQSLLLAQEVAARLGFPIEAESLARIRPTPPQVELSAKERRANIRGAFHCHGPALRGRRVLLVDDVAATGATMEECAREVLKAGAKSAWGITLARGKWRA